MIAALSGLPLSGTLFEDDWDTVCGLGKWNVQNGSAVNKWETGTALGTCCAYISNDGGTSAAYTASSSSTTYIYFDVTLPTNVDTINLNFDWRCDGENGGGFTSYDFGFVGIAKTTYTPSGSFPSGNTSRERIGATSNDGKFNKSYNSGGWSNEDITLSTTNEFVNAGEDVRFIFGWSNDGSVGDNPGFSIDNVILTFQGTPTPPSSGVVQLGTPGTSASGTLGIAPFAVAYDYSFAAWIIEASELSSVGGTADIESLELYMGLMADSTYLMFSQRIYMAHIGSKSTWLGSIPTVGLGSESLSNTTYVKTNFTQSYATADENDWFKFNFDNSFPWNGTDNIVIWWENRDGTYNFGGPTFNIQNKSGSVAYKRADSSYPTGSCSTDTERPIMKLNYT